MKKNTNEGFTYKKYLVDKKKNELTKILDGYKIEYKKNVKKEKLVDLLIDNLEKIVDDTLSIFQEDELISINYVIKRKGLVVVRLNHLLEHFLDNMVANHLMVKIDDEYQMFDEVYSLYKDKLKRKSTINKIKENTKEYNLILGNIDAYGVIDFEYFYNNYSKIYKLSKEKALDRIKLMASFFREFHIIEDNNKKYLASNVIKTAKDTKKYFEEDVNIAVYTNDELIDIHNFKYMKKFRSYKKLCKFIESNYDVEKGSFKIINRFVLLPFYEQYQFDKDLAIATLETLIEKYFEFSKEKTKSKFINLVKTTALDYPHWLLKGHTEREKL